MPRPYITTDELQARVGGAALYLELTDDTVPSDATTDADVEDWIIDAVCDLADGFAASAGYAIPLATADAALLNLYLLDIANYKLKARRGTPSAADTKQYDDAMKMLQRLGDGKLTLPSGASGETGAFANLDFDGNEQMFNRTKLADL